MRSIRPQLRAVFSIVSHSVIVTTDIGTEFGDIRPLDEARVRVMNVNRVPLLDRIDADIAFTTRLASVGGITWPQGEHLCLLYTSDAADE